MKALQKDEAIKVAAVLAIGLTALAGALEIDVLASLFAIVGFVIVLPLVAILGERLPFVESADETPDHPAAETDDRAAERIDPVARLRERYAAGELDDAAFERRLERLLETEDLEGKVEIEGGDGKLEIEGGDGDPDVGGRGADTETGDRDPLTERDQ